MRKVTARVFFALMLCMCATTFAQNAQQAVSNQVNELLLQNKITPEDSEWVIKDQHTSRTSGVHHVYFRQVINGIEVVGSESSVHLLSNGDVLKANTQFMNSGKLKGIASATPSLTPAQAVQSAANHFNYTITEAITEVSSLNNTARETVLSDGGISLEDIPARLVYQLDENKQLRLTWDIAIKAINGQDWWNVFVDAQSGAIQNQVSWMTSCSFDHDHGEHPLNYHANLYDMPHYGEEVAAPAAPVAANTYEVFPMPVESPYYTTPQGTRTIVTDPAHPVASPFGWHDTDGVAGPEFTVTEGNNTDTFENGDNTGYQVDGGATLDFVGYPFDMDYSTSTQYEDASLTNLFYWTNICHDLKYIYGFDEVSGNFQVNNYGNGGLGNDPVNAECQDGAGTCNATMGTPPDGSRPDMSMFVCGDKDGSFDNLVIVHEYTHGTSNRLTGGPSNVNCLFNSEQMGEGWSDWYGVVMTIEAGDAGTDSRGVGTYLFDQGAGGPGIRPFPYSTDLATNPQTYGDIGGLSIPHGVGSVWCTTLWEVTWALIDEHGFDVDFFNFTGDVTQDAGNVQAMALVTEAMKLQVCNPGFVDGRDAIFAADVALYGGANECLLWDAFAKRGLGFSADQGSSGSTTDGTEAFDSPVPAISTAEEVCVGQGVQTYGGGTPTGGVYSGPGVTDNGDGLTYTFDPAAAGIGTHTISYDVTTQCASGAATDTIEVTDDIPEIVCQDHTLELDASGMATLEIQDVVANLIPGGIAVDQTGTFAPIDITATGTTVSLGDDATSAALPVGFDFQFFENTYSDFYISSNGFLFFDAGTDDGCCTGGTIPNGGDGINNIIAFVWEDINPSAGGTIRYETVGTAPDRKLVMEFDNVPFFGTSDAVTTQVHLFEDSGIIEVHSTNVPANGNTTQGVENADGSEGIATPGRNSEVWSATDDYVRFFYANPTPPENCGVATNITLSQSDFDCTDLGDVTVTVTMTDANGNTATCDATVTVTDPLNVCIAGVNDNILDQQVGLFPNPTTGQVTLVNNSNLNLKGATITDVNGRIIQQIDLSEAGTNTNISLEKLASGLYFVQINTEDSSTVKRIVKQ
ncbi:M36 family metallopeptidase [Aureisphaera galaxeae]|uniref:M36 family metallopeptidase n=1 Tax=Aureisphaera galaxeae TaxID=1538023 RepID=UPI002350F1D8|nr:M36 family metallopeptidase [Aureisphaera galaxeae]MDC8003570.1 M36 family metallopeptidase [Aureisphaera galaxeae]